MHGVGGRPELVPCRLRDLAGGTFPRGSSRFRFPPPPTTPLRPLRSTFPGFPPLPWKPPSRRPSPWMSSTCHPRRQISLPAMSGSSLFKAPPCHPTSGRATSSSRAALPQPPSGRHALGPPPPPPMRIRSDLRRRRRGSFRVRNARSSPKDLHRQHLPNFPGKN